MSAAIPITESTCAGGCAGRRRNFPIIRRGRNTRGWERTGSRRTSCSRRARWPTRPGRSHTGEPRPDAGRRARPVRCAGIGRPVRCTGLAHPLPPGTHDPAGLPKSDGSAPPDERDPSGMPGARGPGPPGLIGTGSPRASWWWSCECRQTVSALDTCGPNRETNAGSRVTACGWPVQHTCRLRHTTVSVAAMTRCRSWETRSTPQP